MDASSVAVAMKCYACDEPAIYVASWQVTGKGLQRIIACERHMHEAWEFINKTHAIDSFSMDRIKEYGETEN